MRPRLGTRNSMRARPKPRFVILIIWPRRWPRLGDRADELLGHVHDDALDGLHLLAVDLLGDDLGHAERPARSPRGASSRARMESISSPRP
jgi:hypothetical protein